MSEPTLTIKYLRLPDDELWWCNTHRRRALEYCERSSPSFFERSPCCGNSYKGGIMLPCDCVNLTHICEIEEV